jgi:hypothetical protein
MLAVLGVSFMVKLERAADAKVATKVIQELCQEPPRAERESEPNV